MRRLAVIAILVVGAGVALAASSSADGQGDEYIVRAVFDSADFIVEDEQVRIAGADVGTIQAVDVSQPDELISHEDGGRRLGGKALIMLKIDDPGFRNFREDASCRIRPQSLLGEKFVECLPTQPRAPGSEPPPMLEPIPDGEPGEGQYLLALENNGRAVDLDLVNNIMREPEVDRFRIILSELGAGLAARGEDLAEVIERANPALRETDRVLAILAEQNRQLAQLAQDSDTVLEPLARERRSVRGFIANANEAAQASAERRDDLAVSFEPMPRFMRELRSTMAELGNFSDAGVPLARDLRTAAPPLTRATRELERFAPPASRALVSLGDAAEQSGGPIAESDPVIRQLNKLSRTTAPGAKSLARLLRSLRQSGGIDQLMGFVLNLSNGVNGFDEFGHFMRAQLLVTNCVDYVVRPISGCNANFTGDRSPVRAPAAAADAAGSEDPERKPREREEESSTEPPVPALPPDSTPAPDAEPPEGPTADPEAGEDGAASAKARMRGVRSLLDYLMEDER
jgi:phospholipid/cholesterol/gamma-HCH transport system substrate-binding protein